MFARVLIIFLVTAVTPLSAAAHNFVTGQRVPPVGIADKGELIAVGEEMEYQPWNSARLGGKVRVLMHIAGRLSAKDQNSPLTEALSAASLPPERYQTTLIVDTDDAIPGSAMFVAASLKSSKRQSPESQIIIDSQGAARQAWQLKPGGSTVVVLDHEGAVRFAKQGALTRGEVVQVLRLIKTLYN